MISRESVRDRLASLIEVALVDGDPQLAQAVYNHQKVELDAASPIVLVYGGGIGRPRATMLGNSSRVLLWVDIFVSLTGTGWTEADAEDRLDDIEQAVAEVLESNYDDSSGGWHSIYYVEESTVGNVEASGIPYIRELIPIAAEVFG